MCKLQIFVMIYREKNLGRDLHCFFTIPPVVPVVTKTKTYLATSDKIVFQYEETSSCKAHDW